MILGHSGLCLDKMDDEIRRRADHSRADPRIQHSKNGLRKQVRRAKQNTECNHTGHNDIAFYIKKGERAYFWAGKGFDPRGMLAEKPEENKLEKKKKDRRGHRKGEP